MNYSYKTIETDAETGTKLVRVNEYLSDQKNTILFTTMIFHPVQGRPYISKNHPIVDLAAAKRALDHYDQNYYENE